MGAAMPVEAKSEVAARMPVTKIRMVSFMVVVVLGCWVLADVASVQKDSGEVRVSDGQSGRMVNV
jgi:hypothetical protein